MRTGSYQSAAHPLCGATVAAAADRLSLGCRPTGSAPSPHRFVPLQAHPSKLLAPDGMQAFVLRVLMSPF